MTTMYDPLEVAASFGLRPVTMPLLASLLNTDYISRDKLSTLQYMAGDRDGRRALTERLAELIREEDLRLPPQLQVPDSWESTGSESPTRDPEEEATLVKNVVARLFEGTMFLRTYIVWRTQVTAV